MEITRVIGLLIVIGALVLAFLFLCRKEIFKSLKDSKRSEKVVTVIATFIAVTAVVFGFCMVVWFGIHLMVR